MISVKETLLTPNYGMERIKPLSELDIDSFNLADVWKEWKDSLIRDQIVVGINDPKLRERLLR